MKKVFLYTLLLVLVSSCAARKGGSTEKLNVEQFNKTISQRIDINSASELAELFYNWSPHKPTANLEITTKEVKNGEFEIRLIHTDVPDSGDIKDIKLELKAKREMQVWTVLEANKSWKCKSGRGKDNWSNADCK